MVPTSSAGAGGSGPSTGTAGAAASGAAGSTPTAGTAGTTGMTGTAGTAPPVAGTAGTETAGTMGTATAGTGGGATADGYKPKCIAKGAELALIGDSWINYALGENLAPRLQQRAQRDGALAASDRFNDQAVGGSSLASGGIAPLIPTTWDTAKTVAMRADTTVKFVVMDGGGNDVLLGNAACLENGTGKAQDPSCQKTVMDATAAGRMLQARMKMDGVGQAIYFFYPHVPAGGWDMIDYALPMARETCEGMNSDTFQCTFVDTRDLFQGPGNTGVAMAQYIGLDGIHPTPAGMERLADELWKVMKEKCMAQTAESGGGCCTP
jgi:lysophospholipase L1-like esterase